MIAAAPWAPGTAGKRQAEFIALLERLDREIPATVRTIHVVLDNLRMHEGKQVQAWLAEHPRFVFHHPPVHCSWMNQVEKAFSKMKSSLRDAAARTVDGLIDLMGASCERPGRVTCSHGSAVVDIGLFCQPIHPIRNSSKEHRQYTGRAC